ncbi:MAG TPA: Holliday junction branch migration protein RuvA [Bacillota bacterium]|nr:Holliday junction branch migration protein RuvA [Bacillota bacterium]HOL09195.1 Holliday junction branch migration protein RuvA [Bacillota bacterium]HPO97019.1 Holliday junction branch migration protein RuvA [Bacillota bacterium]
MIATLSGVIDSVSGESCIINVNGVGYQVFMPLTALESLSRENGTVKIYTHYHQREDGVSLYGFLSEHDKAIFEKIITVSGIGPKTALTILGVLSAERFLEAINNEDHRVLTSVSGVGLKTAQRLILELKGKLARVITTNKDGKAAPALGSVINDAVDALVALGYPQKEAVAAVEAVYNGDNTLTTPELVRKSLKNLGRK